MHLVLEARQYELLSGFLPEFANKQYVSYDIFKIKCIFWTFLVCSRKGPIVEFIRLSKGVQFCSFWILCIITCGWRWLSINGLGTETANTCMYLLKLCFLFTKFIFSKLVTSKFKQFCLGFPPTYSGNGREHVLVLGCSQGPSWHYCQLWRHVKTTEDYRSFYKEKPWVWTVDPCICFTKGC